MKKVIFIFFVLFTYILAAAGNKKYEYILFQVKISDELVALFLDKIRPGTGKEEWKYAFDEIIKSLKESFNAVWITFESQKGKIKDTIIRDAIEKLRIKIKEKKKFIGINFELDDAYGIYYQKKFLKKDGNTILDSTFTYEKMSKNKDVDAGVYKNYSDAATIEVFNGFENFQVLNMEFLDKKKGCKYEGYKDYSETFKNPLEKILPAGWKWTSSKTYSFQSALFHELVHIALEDAGHERSGDEASVEDITLQLFPRNPANKGVAHGANFSEMTYDKALVEGDFQRTNIYNIPGLFLFPIIDLIGNHYYNRKDRKFNPREKFNGIDLKYQESDKIGVFEYLKRIKRGDISCNDAVSKPPLKEYVIPYAKCCNKEKCDPEPVPAREELTNDWGDDNESNASGVMKIANLDPEAVIFSAGHYREAFGLLGGLLFDGNNTAEELIKITKFLVLPSGSLTGNENPLFKNLLANYVKLGGTLVVLAQPRGKLFSEVLPVPENGVLSAFGWREDQSCYF